MNVSHRRVFILFDVFSEQQQSDNIVRDFGCEYLYLNIWLCCCSATVGERHTKASFDNIKKYKNAFMSEEDGRSSMYRVFHNEVSPGSVEAVEPSFSTTSITVQMCLR